MTDGEPVPPSVEFFSLYPDAPAPEPASGSVRGSLPSRAVQKCLPVTEASSFGWYVFPPLDFAVRWDGQDTEWSPLDDRNDPVGWESLSGGHEGAVPGVREALETAPERFRSDFAVFDRDGRPPVPFVNADPRAINCLEIITGLLMRTSPGWSVLTRGLPNWPHQPGHQILEGIIETDWFRSAVPTMVRLTEPGRVVRFHRRLPIMVVQVVPRVAVTASSTVDTTTARGLAEFPDDVWAEFVASRQRRGEGGAAAYRAEQRARQRTRRQQGQG